MVNEFGDERNYCGGARNVIGQHKELSAGVRTEKSKLLWPTYRIPSLGFIADTEDMVAPVAPISQGNYQLARARFKPK